MGQKKIRNDSRCRIKIRKGFRGSWKIQDGRRAGGLRFPKKPLKKRWA